MTLENFSVFVGIGMFVMQVAIVLGVIGWFFIPTVRAFIASYTTREYVWMAFMLTVVAIVASLVFQYAYLLTVCPLCWYQRIFMYPLAVLFGVSLWKRQETLIAPYAIVLGVIGMVIAIYHSILQYYTLITGTEASIPCGATILEASCAEVSWVVFGYLTFPMVAVTTFSALLALSYLSLKRA
jgi:disulfide bond formation protein DsbB